MIVKDDTQSMHVQQYCETLFSVSYSGQLRIHQQLVDHYGPISDCLMCDTALLTAYTFEIVTSNMILRIQGGDVCSDCSQLILAGVARKHEVRLKMIDNFMIQRKMRIAQSLKRAILDRPIYQVFESTAKKEVRKWLKYYDSIRVVLRPHFRIVPFYLTYRITYICGSSHVCRVCNHRLQNRAIVMVFDEYSSRVLLRLCDYCQRLLFLSYTR